MTPTHMQQLADQLGQELNQLLSTETHAAAVAQCRSEMMTAINSRTDQLSNIEISKAELIDECSVEDQRSDPGSLGRNNERREFRNNVAAICGCRRGRNNPAQPAGSHPHTQKPIPCT